MKKLIKIIPFISICYFLLFTIFFLFLMLLSDFRQYSKTTEERIMDSVVLVDGVGSGVVIYSDDQFSIVLTAFHVIRDTYLEIVEKEKYSEVASGIEIPKIKVSYMSILFEHLPIPIEESYDVDDFCFNEQYDLAILIIHPKRKLPFSKLSNRQPRLGEDIWIGANPDLAYRSLKKGIISSTERYLGFSKHVEISGGVVYGSSGGGAFDVDGRLFGVIRAVRIYEGSCFGLQKKDGTTEQYCNRVPLTFMGMVVRNERLKDFILLSKYGIYFNYLD